MTKPPDCFQPGMRVQAVTTKPISTGMLRGLTGTVEDSSTCEECAKESEPMVHVVFDGAFTLENQTFNRYPIAMFVNELEPATGGTNE